MITTDNFIKSVGDAFSYLHDEFGYAKPVFDSVPRKDTARYYKGTESIRIGYSYANDYLDVYHWPIENDYASAILLPYMLKMTDPDFEYYLVYHAIMPSEIGFEESVSKVSDMLRRNLEAFVNFKDK